MPTGTQFVIPVFTTGTWVTVPVGAIGYTASVNGYTRCNVFSIVEIVRSMFLMEVLWIKTSDSKLSFNIKNFSLCRKKNMSSSKGGESSQCDTTGYFEILPPNSSSVPTDNLVKYHYPVPKPIGSRLILCDWQSRLWKNKCCQKSS